MKELGGDKWVTQENAPPFLRFMAGFTLLGESNALQTHGGRAPSSDSDGVDGAAAQLGY